ncbi:MAG: TrbI/VirB10 family protein [Legionella sp.]|nr:TrbI/VirB10 family protein [Legionella sp.]
MGTENNNLKLNDLGTASKVTPNPRKQQLIHQGQFILLGLVCIIILCVMFLPNKSKANAPAEKPASNVEDATLAQNLEAIERLKLLERNKQFKQQQPSKTNYGPPKLRSNHGGTKSLTKEMRLRMNAPTSFEVEIRTPGATNSSMDGGVQVNSSQTLVGADQNSQFINNQNDITSVSDKKLPHPALTIPAGEMISATLETAINSDLPGMTRAITTRDVYSLMNGNLLIPKGSTLVGQFSSGIIEGQSRILVVWNRVQMADGVIVTLNSPGTDILGRSGQGADSIDRHFFERFGTSALLSVLGAYSATAGVGAQDQYNSASQYRMAIANSFGQTSNQTLEKSINIAATLQINQGTPINVFVAHDLDFAAVGIPKVAPPQTFRSPTWK